MKTDKVYEGFQLKIDSRIIEDRTYFNFYGLITKKEHKFLNEWLRDKIKLIKTREIVFDFTKTLLVDELCLGLVLLTAGSLKLMKKDFSILCVDGIVYSYLEKYHVYLFAPIYIMK